MALPLYLQSLLSPRAYPHPVTQVRFVETHISWLLLTGTRVYKIKRPVHFPFVDLRSAERREFLCHEEVRLNRRFAPGVYLGVAKITADSAGARIDGTGPVLESCVRMQQFDSGQQLDHLLERGAIQPNELFEFGRDLARIHATLPAVDAVHDWGRPEAVRAMLLRNFDECAEALSNVQALRNAVPAALGAKLDAAAKSAAGWMADRRSRGRVRECHGDLHCSNIVRLAGRLCAFDGLEFDPAMRWIDTADEIAFLLADLAPYDNPSLQQAFLGGYLLESGDYDACRFLFLYQAHRFLVRAKVIALSGEGRSAGAYVEAARRVLGPKRPVLILMSGLSGSGKSWLAQRLAPDIGAVHVRSDVERKRLAGMASGARATAEPGTGLYTAERSEQANDRLLASAEALLAGGYTTIADATFIRRRHRKAFLQLAARLGIQVRIIRCEASEDLLRARIEARTTRGTDPSDADLPVLEWQLAHDEPFDSDEAGFVMRFSSEDPETLDTARTRLQPLLQSARPFD
jgi:aminoglycoside phosphotransferase family enzyme/predicted kinase